MSESTWKNNENCKEKSENKNICVPEPKNCSKDDDSSQELFSDDESNERIIRSPHQSIGDCSFLNSFKASVSFSDLEEHSPRQPTIPKTPLSLAPFITKNNDPWTSDLETPHGKVVSKAQVSSTDRVECLKNVGGTSNQQLTPVLGKMQSEDFVSASPVLCNSKRKLPKRQIFKSNVHENLKSTPSLENMFEEDMFEENVFEAENLLITDSVAKEMETVVPFNPIKAKEPEIIAPSREEKNLETISSIGLKEKKEHKTVVLSNPEKAKELETILSSSPNKVKKLETIFSSSASKVKDLETVSSSSPNKLKELESMSSSSPNKLKELESMSSSSLNKVNELETISSSSPNKVNELKTISSSSPDVKENEMVSSCNRKEELISIHKDKESNFKSNNNDLPESSKLQKRSSHTSPEAKALGDIVRKVKHLLKTEEKFKISEVNISESDLLKDVIQLERASTKFAQPVKKIQPCVNQIGLVSFSEFFKNCDEEAFNEADKQDKNNLKIQRTSTNEMLTQKEIDKNQCCQSINQSKSPVSKQTKIYNNLQKNSETIKSPFKEDKILEEHEEFSEDILCNAAFSQYFNDDVSKGNSTVEAESHNEENKENEANTEDFNELDQDLFKDEDLNNGLVTAKESNNDKDLNENSNEESGFNKDDLNEDEDSNEDKDLHTNEDKDLNKNEDKDLNKNKDKDLNKNKNKDLNKNKDKDLNKDKYLNKNEDKDDIKNEDMDKSKNKESNKGEYLNEDQNLNEDENSNEDKGLNKEKNLNEDQNLNKMNDLFEDEDLIKDFSNDFCEELTPQVLKNFNAETPRPAPTFSGFSTAGGRNIKIDRERLETVEKLYNDFENADFSSIKTKKITNIYESPSTSKCTSFQSPLTNFKSNFSFATTSGNNISIKKENLSSVTKNEVKMPSDEKITLDKENWQKGSPVSITGKETPIKTNFFSKASCLKRTSTESVTFSKKFKALNVGIGYRNSIGLNKNLGSKSSVESITSVKSITSVESITSVDTLTSVDKSLSSFPVPRAYNNESRNMETFTETENCGFRTARGKNIAIENKNLITGKDIFSNIDESEDLMKIEIPKSHLRKCFNLPGIKLQFKSSTNTTESLITTEPESPPFCGFSSQNLTSESVVENSMFLGFDSVESATSGALVVKHKVLFIRHNLQEEGKNNPNYELIAAQTTKISQKLIEDENTLLNKLSKGASNTKTSNRKEEVENHLSKLPVSKISVEKEESPVGFATPGDRKISIKRNALSASKSFSANVSQSKVNSKFKPIIKSTPTKMFKNQERVENQKIEDQESVNNASKSFALLEENLNPVSELSKLSQSSDRKSLWNSILKRKIDDVDSDTPLGRHISNSKKPKLNLDLHGRKLFSEESISDDEVENETHVQIESLNEAGPSSSTDLQEKVLEKSTSGLTSDSITNDTKAFADMFQPFYKDTENDNKEHEFKMDFETEDKEFADIVSCSPVLGRSRPKKKRRSRMVNSTFDESESVKDKTVESINLQILESECVGDNLEILEKRITAALELDKIISRKKRENPRPVKGTFLLNRDENKKSRISLYKLANGSTPKLRSLENLAERGINPDVLNITATTAESYRFKIKNIDRQLQRNCISLKVGDGATLVFDENGSVGVKEFEQSFEASPGVDPSLLPSGWIRNHYRWIVWKLASMDRMKLGSADIPKMLTPDRVMKDLKYRYDREIDRSQRPAIRKILEKDDVASKRLVLCVSTITESSENEKEEKDPRILLRTPRWKIEVTDGWYSLPVSFDSGMVNHIIDGKIQEGTKIVTYGAELLNCDQGCFPLEKPGDVCLKIHTNSTRRARWDAKLGYQRISGPIISNLKDIDPNGGFIGQVDVVISRIYPIMYREKTADGQTIYRNEKTEEKAAADYEHQCQLKAEAIYAEEEKKCEGPNNDSSEDDTAAFFAKYESSEYLSESERMKIFHNQEAKRERLKQRVNEKLKENLPPPRQVVPVHKVRVVQEETCAILTIWSKSDDISILKEGSSYSIFNISAYGKRDGELNLTASRQVIFKPKSASNQSYPCRVFTPLKEISVPGFDPPYCELDTVGIVSWIGNTLHGMKNFEAICISYPNEDTTSYLLILFWQGISSHGFSNILTKGSLIACSNLEIRRTRNASNLPCCYCSERTVFSRNPRQPHLLNVFQDLKKQITNTNSYASTCEEEISTIIEKKPATRLSTPGILNSSDRNSGNYSPHFAMVKTPMDVDTPVKSAATQKRFERLSRYAEPPELSPIVFTNSRNTKSSFRPLFQTPVSSRTTKPDTT